MIRQLLLLNGLAVLGVVLNHAIGWGFVAMFWWTDRYRAVAVPNFDQLGTPSYYSLRTVEQIAISSIPAFLFVSGFFIAIATGQRNTTISWRLVGVRIVNLLIPYLIWSCLIFGADYLLLGVAQTPWQYLKLLAMGGAISGFYYVPLLCQLYLLSPLLVLFAKRNWQLFLIVSLLVQGSVQMMQYLVILDMPIWSTNRSAQLYNWVFPGYLFWFSFGIVAGFHAGEFKQWLTRIRWLLPLLTLLMLPLGVMEWEWLLRLSGEQWLTPVRLLSDELFCGLLILSFFAFNDFALPFAKQLSQLGTKSYGIYLVHSLVLLWTAKLIYRLEPQLLSYQLLYQIVLLAMGMGIPLLLMALVNHSPARRYYHYIFG